MVASGWNGTLYVGVTSGLIKRVWEHKHDVVDGFTKQYGVHDLVWFEQHWMMDRPSLAKRRSRRGGAHGKSGRSKSPIRGGAISIRNCCNFEGSKAGFRPPPE
jgi:hypothetical protein